MKKYLLLVLLSIAIYKVSHTQETPGVEKQFRQVYLEHGHMVSLRLPNWFRLGLRRGTILVSAYTALIFRIGQYRLYRLSRGTIIPSTSEMKRGRILKIIRGHIYRSTAAIILPGELLRIVPQPIIPHLHLFPK